MKFQVFYMKPSWFVHGIMGELPNGGDIEETHIFLGEVEMTNLEALFRFMQGEEWSPNGEARKFITEKGLMHTSMSVGDVAVDADTGEIFQVANIGFKRIGKMPVEPRDALPSREAMLAM